MDEEYNGSIDTSTDMDVSEVDVSDDIPTDIPDDIPEDVPEDDYSDADISDDFTEDVSDESAVDDVEYDETDESMEEDSIEPETDELHESIDDIEEDSLEGSKDIAEDNEELDDIPEDTDDLDEEQTDEVVDATEEIPEDTDDYEVTDQEEGFDEDIQEDVTDAETTDGTSDVEDTETTDQPEDVTDAETVDGTSDADDKATAEQSDNQSELETYDYETSSETQDVVAPETSGEFVSAENPYRERWEEFGEEFSDGSEHWVCPVCGKNLCVCDSGNDDGDDTPPPPDDPEKVLKRNEFDLLKSGNDAINQRLEAKADDYRDKGLSEEEITDRLAADKWEYQKEFLDDAFPGEDISPNVFNGFNEHGAKDRIDEMEKSPFLREILTGKRTDESSDSSRDVVDDKASEYNKTLKDFCENNGYVKNADFSDFDPHVAYDLAKSVVDAKKDFPELDVNYLGSIDHQVKGLHDTVEASRFDFYKQNGFDEGLAQQMAKQYADDFISNSRLDDTKGTYAWSLRTGNPSLDKYDGVAVNNDYAKDYTRFKSEKQADEIAKWAPIGCGSPKAVADHELGHEIDNLLGASNDTVINDLYSNMMRDNKAEAVLSGYSRKNVKEFIAEAYSEYRNNPNPREISQSVYNRLIELRDQKALARRLI